MKKGFTLVELLAVIVILGVIAAITTPIMRGVIENSRRESFLDSVNGIIQAVELDAADKGFGIYQVYEIDGNSDPQIDPFIQIQGSVSGEGHVTINQDGDIDVLIEFDSWCAYKPIDTNVLRLYDAPCIENADTVSANRPYLHDDMIPVIHDGDDILMVDTINSPDEPWYDYANSIWANAVIVAEEHVETYENSLPGTEVNRDHVLLELVWIPRYRYQLNGNLFSIKFESGAPIVTNKVDSDGYRIHDAFTFGRKNLRGFWISKYQLSGSLNLVESKRGETDYINDYTANAAFNSIASINTLDNPYGLSPGIVNTRLQKNSEWAAIAYLAQSDFGVGTNQITVGGSTTNNDSGVFDMVGPIGDFVMSSYNNRAGGSLMFTFPDEKYYDLYESENIITACNDSVCYGHGLSETDSFYGGVKNFVTGPRPFLVRGVDNIFSYNNSTGAGDSNEGFKLTISRR